MITNKKDYQTNKELYYILTQLEKAISKQDAFSVSILITRLKLKGFIVEEGVLV